MRSNKKYVWLVAIVLILVLSLSLVACKPDDKKIVKEPLNTVQVIETIAAKLKSDMLISNPRRLNIDISATAQLEEQAQEDAAFWKYELVIKGNVDLTANAKENDTNLYIAMDSYDKENTKTSLFSLLYESEYNANGQYSASYFYLILPQQEEPLKINAISLLKLIPGSNDSGTEIDVANYLALALSLLVKEGKQVDDNNYQLTTDMTKMWTVVETLILPILKDPASLSSSLPGVDVVGIFAQIDKLIPQLFPDAVYVTQGEDGTAVEKKVESIVDMYKHIEQNLPTTDIVANFSFDGDAFKGVSIEVNYQDKVIEGETAANVHKFNLSIDKLKISAGEYVAYDDGYPLSATQRKEMIATGNLLTFSLMGKVDFVGAEVGSYTVEINADLNPLVLIDGLDMDNLANIGTMSLVMNNDTTGENMITIYLDGAAKEIIVSYKSPKALLSSNLSFGGEYSFDALESIIAKMTPQPAPVDPDAPIEPSQPGEEEPSVLENILNALFDRVNTDDIYNNGVIIEDIAGLVNSVMDNIDLGLGGFIEIMVKTAIQACLFDNADSIAITIPQDGFVYGTSDIPDKAELALPGHYLASVGALLDDTKSVTTAEYQANYEYGEPFKMNVSGGAQRVNHSFTISGTNRDGATADFNAVYYGYDGYDPYKVGKQNVTVYYGINSGLADTFNDSLIGGFLSGIDSMIPLFGAHSMVVEVNVYPQINTENVFLNIQGGTTMLAGDSIANALNAVLVYSDSNGRINNVNVTDSMISCAQPVIKDGKFLYAGNFDITINYKGITIQQKVMVKQIIAEQLGATVKVGQDVKTVAAFQLVYFEKDGSKIVEDIPATYLKATKSSGYDLPTELVVEGKISGNAKLLDTDITMFYEYEYEGEKKEVSFNIGKLVNDNNISSISSAFNPIIPSNMEWTAEGVTTYGVYVEHKVGDKTYRYYPLWDSENQTIELVPNGDAPAWENPPSVKLIFTQTHQMNEAGTAFEALTQEVEPFELTNDKLTLDAGKYDMRLEVGDMYGVESITVNPLVMFGNTAMFSSSINDAIKISISAVGFTDAPKGVTNVVIKYVDGAFGFYMNGKDTEGKDVSIKVNVADASLTINSAQMYVGDEWVAATFTNTGELNNADFFGTCYKFDVTVTVGEETFTGESTLNSNKGPK